MRPILAGIETEYGLYVENRGAENQIDDAMALVRSYPGERFVGWDYRYESPRADLRGFRLDRLAFDPEDARFDEGKSRPPESEVRSDRILPNGARLYNDHGHPEYATPECWSLSELARHDMAGERAVLLCARELELKSGAKVRAYKNNTDFHGASYGTHESYLVPRELGFERLYRSALPILVARQVLCGAGKVGAESGSSCVFQLSQRADFFVDSASAETLYRRPIFNTRDEPHADPVEWIRLHVICGDANMIPAATRRKVGLVKLAIALEEAGDSPIWRLRDPVSAFRAIGRDETFEFRVELEGKSWTTAREIIESYLSAAERVFGFKPSDDPKSIEGEFGRLISECRSLFEDLAECPERFRVKVDWAAKKAMLERYMEEAGSDWRDPSLRSFDLEYHNIDPDEGLFHALSAMGEVELLSEQGDLDFLLESAEEGTRARARGIAVKKFGEHLKAACWASLTFESAAVPETEVFLRPDVQYGPELEAAEDLGTFIELLRRINDNASR